MSAAGLTAAQARRWITRAVEVLEEHRPALDTLNVLPVPDADTGSNLHLTFRDAAAAADAAHASTDDGVQVLAALTRGVLVGARGSSGVIVGQYVAALLDQMADGGGVGATAQALAAAARAARSAVAEPLEGTVLTIADVIARHAADLAASGRAASTGETLGAAVAAGVCALPGTRETQPVLRAAGVPDAGAWGLLLVLGVLVTTVAEAEGLELAVDVPIPSGVPRPGALDQGVLPGGEFEVMFLEESVQAGGVEPPAAAGELRAALSALGDSVALVTADGVWQAHVHTDHPVDVLALPVARGRRRHQTSVRHLVQQTAVHGERRPPLGLVAVTRAPGLVADLARAGAVVLVERDDRALTAEAVGRAVADTGAAEVLVLGAGELPDLAGLPDLAVPSPPGPPGPPGVPGVPGVQGVPGVRAHVRPGVREGGLVAAAAALLEASGVAPSVPRPAAGTVLLAVDRALGALHLVEVELPADHASWAAVVVETVVSGGRTEPALVRVLLPVDSSDGGLAERVSTLVLERGGPATDVVVLHLGAPSETPGPRAAIDAQVTVEPELVL